ncbi:hypothetical protein CTA1_876 [Colletotrichum tanaceti]|uniref:Uncharacterized protein n=1 Tax=Colletotrichum tanaceti TaxID=1306861 RepID=A0A4U6XT98_9PEZI|nr:hypothetical protein CTA1_876 [Colletotrichum tanaceti]
MGIIKAVYQIAQAGNKDGTFLQLNLGIIAACAAAIKPLVTRRPRPQDLVEPPVQQRRPLREQVSSPDAWADRADSTQHGDGQETGVQGAGEPEGAPDHDIEEDGGGGGGGGTVKHHPTAVVVYGNKNSFGDRSGSEEMILEADSKLGGGITRTTEVRVQRWRTRDEQTIDGNMAR